MRCRRSARPSWRSLSVTGWGRGRLPAMDLLKQLSETPGVSGREERVRELIEKELKGVVDELTVDAMGNLTAIKRSTKDGAPKAMIAAHMDEIGFYVRHI